MEIMIDHQKFINNFKYFDKEIVCEIIELFIEEYPSRFSTLQQNINESDFESIQFNAHSLKGVISNFLAPDTKELARQLEEKGKKNNPDNISELFEELKSSTEKLLKELEILKNKYYS